MKTPARPASLLSLPGAAAFVTLFHPAPLHAHHAMDGNIASTAAEGFLSGLAHPVIGIDHLAMIIAVGILAAMMRPGFLLAGVFVVGAMGGTGWHLLRMSLPGSELLVALSVVAVGCLAAFRRPPAAGLALGVCALAGALHGYAYGEAIVGAEAGPVLWYLAGFTLVQLAVAGCAFAAARGFQKRSGEAAALRPAGFMVVGAGMVLVAAQIVALTLPG